MTAEIEFLIFCIKFNRPFAKKNFIFFLESTIKNKLKSKISEF
jgi:hypothetical protein